MGHEADDRDRGVGPGLQRVARVNFAPRLVLWCRRPACGFPVAEAAVQFALGGGQELHGRFGGDGRVVIPELHRALDNVHAARVGERGPGHLADRFFAAGQIDPQLHDRIAGLLTRAHEAAIGLHAGIGQVLGNLDKSGAVVQGDLLAQVFADGHPRHPAFIVNRQQALGIEILFRRRIDEVVEHGVGLGLLEFHLRRTDGRAAAEVSGREPLFGVLRVIRSDERELHRRDAVSIGFGHPVFRRAGVGQIPRDPQFHAVDFSQEQALALRPVDRTGSEDELRQGSIGLAGDGPPLDRKAVQVSDGDVVARLPLLQRDRGIDPVVEGDNRTGQQDQQPGVRDHEAELPRLPGNANERGGEDVRAQHSQQDNEPSLGIEVPAGVVPPLVGLDEGRRGQDRGQQHDQRHGQFQRGQEAENGFWQFQQDRNIAHRKMCPTREEMAQQTSGGEMVTRGGREVNIIFHFSHAPTFGNIGLALLACPYGNNRQSRGISTAGIDKNSVRRALSCNDDGRPGQHRKL